MVNARLPELLSTLVNNDMRFEVIVTSLIELLKEAKDSNGNPLITQAAMDKKCAETRDTFIKEMELAKPPTGLVLPGNSGLSS